MPDTVPLAGHPGSAVPRIICDAHATTACLPAPGGALWKRQLDANLIHLPRGQRIDTHAEPDLDVLFLVLAGAGTLGTVGESLILTSGTILWLPRGSSRSLTTGDNGMSYLTVHRRRPGMQIRSRSDLDATSPAKTPLPGGKLFADWDNVALQTAAHLRALLAELQTVSPAW